jgi:hypothetical protein
VILPPCLAKYVRAMTQPSGRRGWTTLLALSFAASLGHHVSGHQEPRIFGGVHR